MASVRVILLDRDGVINREVGPFADWSRWEWLPRVPEALMRLQQAGYFVSIVTNQSGVGRGYFSEDQLRQLHQQVAVDCERLQGAPGFWPRVVYCPHAPGAKCDCRKPATGMWERYLRPRLGRVDTSHSWMVGDADRDIVFGKRLGFRTVRVPDEVPGLWEFTEELLRNGAITKSTAGRSE